MYDCRFYQTNTGQIQFFFLRTNPNLNLDWGFHFLWTRSIFLKNWNWRFCIKIKNCPPSLVYISVGRLSCVFKNWWSPSFIKVYIQVYRSYFNFLIYFEMISQETHVRFQKFEKIFSSMFQSVGSHTFKNHQYSKSSFHRWALRGWN
jgi:hypothetical protein